MSVYNDYSDEQLLALLRKDDLHAFDTIYHTYWGLLYNTAYKNLKDSEQCKEIVHDVLLDIWERRKVLAINNFTAYLKTAIRFRVINFITRNPPAFFFEQIDAMFSSPYSAESTVIVKDLNAMIEAFVQMLPEKRRKIFVGSFLQNLTTKEIACNLNISQKTVQNQLNTALQFFREKFKHLLSFFSL